MPSRVVRSVERLQSVEHCLAFEGTDSLDLPESAPSCGFALFGSLEVLLLVNKDRKFGVIRRIPISTRKRPHYVVQGRSEIVDTIADNGAPPQWWLTQPLNIVTAVAPVLSDDVEGVRFFGGEPIDLGIESVQMFFCPVQLDVNVI